MTKKVFNPKIPTSLIGLIIANILPIFGVIFRNLSIEHLFILYWSESAIIIVFTILKMKKTEKLGDIKINGESPKSKESFINFFCIQFLPIMVVPLVFLIALSLS